MCLFSTKRNTDITGATSFPHLQLMRKQKAKTLACLLPRPAFPCWWCTARAPFPLFAILVKSSSVISIFLSSGFCNTSLYCLWKLPQDTLQCQDTLHRFIHSDWIADVFSSDLLPWAVSAAGLKYICPHLMLSACGILWNTFSPWRFLFA